MTVKWDQIAEAADRLKDPPSARVRSTDAAQQKSEPPVPAFGGLGIRNPVVSSDAGRMVGADEVACPRCYQPAGAPCQRQGGRPSDKFHVERVMVAPRGLD